MQVPRSAFSAPIMPRMPDQENMDAQTVAKRLEPRLKMSATECKIVRQLSISHSNTHLQLCFHCATCKGILWLIDKTKNVSVSLYINLCLRRADPA